MYITCNRMHSSRIVSLVLKGKFSKASKYYENDCESIVTSLGDAGAG